MCRFYRYTYICLYIRYVLVFRFTHVDDLYLSVSDSADPTVGYTENIIILPTRVPNLDCLNVMAEFKIKLFFQIIV